MLGWKHSKSGRGLRALLKPEGIMFSVLTKSSKSGQKFTPYTEKKIYNSTYNSTFYFHSLVGLCIFKIWKKKKKSAKKSQVRLTAKFQHMTMQV